MRRGRVLAPRAVWSVCVWSGARIVRVGLSKDRGPTLQSSASGERKSQHGVGLEQNRRGAGLDRGDIVGGRLSSSQP